MAADKRINKAFCTDRIHVDYAHVGLFDVKQKQVWIARKKWDVTPVRVSHARLLVGGTQDTSTADKDRYLCFWYHTPNTGEGYVHGYPIEWDEGHLMIRLDPNWDYAACAFIPNTDPVKVEKNIEQQYVWGQRIFEMYVAMKPPFPLNWHMVGPRAADSMFYIQRHEPRE